MAKKKVAKRKRKYVFPMDVVRLVQKVEKKILEEPKRFDMGLVAERVPDSLIKDGPEEYPPCGTVGCIAGWIGIVGLGPKLKWLGRKDAVQGPNRELLQYAEARLGLPDQWRDTEGKAITCTAHNLFYEHYWPEPYRNRFYDAKTKRQEARVAVQRLEYLLRTGK